MARLLVDIGPLRESRDFRLLFGGQVFSMLGTQLTLVAIAWQVQIATQSTFMVGVVSAVQIPLLLVGSLWGGALGDRVDRRTVLTVTAVVLALFSCALALNASLGHNNLPILFVLAALSSGVAGFGNPARNAAIPRLVKPEQLIGAYSINQLVIQTASIAGPPIAGVLLLSGVATCFWIDAATYVVLALSTSRMNRIPPEGDHQRTSILRSIGDGFSYVRSHTVAQCVYLVDLNAMIFGMPMALFPALALTRFHGLPKTTGPLIVGLLFAAPAVGAFVGALTTGVIERVRRRGRAVVIAVMVWGAAIAGFGFSSWLWMALVFLAIAGWADVISAVLRNTLLQSSIEDTYRGRLSAIQMAVVQGGPRLGNFEAGVVANLVSTEFSIVSGGIACIVGAVALARWRPTFWTATNEPST